MHTPNKKHLHQIKQLNALPLADLDLI